MKALSLALIALYPAIACAQATQGSNLNFQNSTLFSRLASPGGPNAIQQQGLEYVIPELIIGGEWTSTLRITNRSANPTPLRQVYFFDNAGNPMTATFQTSVLLSNGTTTPGPTLTDTGFTFTLAPGGIAETTFASGTQTNFGHAVIDICSSTPTCSSAGLYAEIILKNHNSTRPDFESVFPLEQPVALQYMLWDSRNGISNVLYLVSDNTSPTVVTLDFLNPGGLLIRSVNVTIPAQGSQILTLQQVAPEIIGQQGTLAIKGVNISGTAALITATALRINPTNSFTPVRAFVPSPAPSQ